MRKLTTAITAAALAFSMMAAAVPAAAVTGYDSAYAGESAFVNITGGQTQNFQVFFANVGTTSWTKGSATEVDLAACLEDKVTCNAQDASEATWNPSTGGWLSAVRYATTTQSVTPPGSLGTFSYNIQAPVGVAAGIFHFNGDLVLASTGERIHPEGYFQDANTGATAGAATLTGITPVSGSANGGTSVSITGSGIICTPAFPTVSFGGTNAVVTSCGATALTASSPAHATGVVTVTVTNTGAGPSNGLSFTYNDTTPPSFTAASVASNVVTITFSEPTCATSALPVQTATGPDWIVKNVANATTNVVTGESVPVCDATKSNGVTSAFLFLTTAFPPGAFVEVDLLATGAAAPPCVNNTSCNPRYVDAAGNTINAPQAQTMTATNPSSTPPTMTSASGAVAASKVTINFSTPVWCDAANGFAPGDFTLDDNNPATTDPTFTAVDPAVGSNKCGGTQQTAGTPLVLLTSKALPADTTYTLKFTQPTGTAGAVKNVYNVALASGSIVSFTTGAADFTPPTMIDARMVFNAGPSTDFVEAGDSFSVTFSEKMNGSTTGTISIQDQDGTTATINCAAGATCSWNTAVTTMTVTLTAALANMAGTTPGMQIPFNITALTGITDLAGNPPNVLGSADRLVDYE